MTSAAYQRQGAPNVHVCVSVLILDSQSQIGSQSAMDSATDDRQMTTAEHFESAGRPPMQWASPAQRYQKKTTQP